jgi:hypothetical protein
MPHDNIFFVKLSYCQVAITYFVELFLEDEATKVLLDRCYRAKKAKSGGPMTKYL